MLPPYAGKVRTAESTLAANCEGGPHARAIARLHLFARYSSFPILIEGESGTGKSWLARQLHTVSPRARGPFVEVVLSSVDDAFASSELFGHVQGAFIGAARARAGAFASANAGTLFLDEIGKASEIVQHRLLHAIEGRELRPLGSDRPIPVDVRLIAASNVDLEELVASGRFLPDLYARLQLFRVRLPPLRERRAAIPGLITSAIQRYASECGYSTPPTVAPELMAAFVRAEWRYNLRQLDATVHRLLVEAQRASELTLLHCTDDLSYLRSLGGPERPVSDEAIAQALASAPSKQASASKAGVHRTTLWRREQRLRR
jgi:DNA-binding NtrC family response regulator